MTHGMTKVMMPIGPMDTIAFIEIHRVRYVRQKIVSTVHVGVQVLYINVKLARHGWEFRYTGRNQETSDYGITFISI